LNGRTICLEMLRNGLHASDGTWRKQCHSYQQLVHEGALELLFWYNGSFLQQMPLVLSSHNF
jgi:hypothetical protein